MRIDYSEPRQSYGSVEHDSYGGGGGRYREERPSSPRLMLLLIMLGIGFVGGFCVGWYFSQQAAKKSFRAAMEQQSLESSKNPQKQPADAQPGSTAQSLPGQQPVSQFQNGPSAPSGSPAAGQQPQSAAPSGQVPLSFFENLPKGQKQAVLGSGINEKPKPAQPAAAQQPATPAAAPAKPADKAQAATSGYLVQVASFSSQKEAEATRARLAAKGYSAAISEVRLPDKGIWYRVRIGRHLEKDAASEIAGRIGGGAKIVPDQEP